MASKKENITYSLQECQNEALRFTNKTAFKVQAGRIYSYAYKKGWLEDICSHMPIKKKKDGYWTIQKCKEEALKFTTRSVFAEKSASAYSIAKRNNWLDEICAHMIVVGNSSKRAIYAFIFENNYVYVGLSWDIEKRKYQHLSNSQSPVFKHIINTNSKFIFKQLTDFLIKEEAVEKEAFYISDFSKKYTLLNTAKAGALGGTKRLWTKEKCLEEALDYDYRQDFKLNSKSAYEACVRYNWLDDVCSHMIKRKPNPAIRKWTFVKCKSEAQKYKNRTEFQEKAGGAYNAARKMNILDEICSHMKPREIKRYWTEKKCQEEALKYKTKTEFKNGSAGAHYAAVKGKFLNEICTHMSELRKSKGFWTYENCKTEALKYKSRSQFNKMSSRAYIQALKNEWLDEICSHMKSNIKPKNYWTKKQCQKEALKFDSRSQFQKYSNAAYCKSARENWLDEICSHMVEIKKPNNYWTKEKCLNIAIHFKSKSEFRKNHPNIYAQAHRKGFLDEICSHMEPERRPANYWTKENIIKEMTKYKTRKDFNKNAGGAAMVARGYDWYDELWEMTH